MLFNRYFPVSYVSRPAFVLASAVLMWAHLLPMSARAAEPVSMHEHEVTNVLHWLDGNYTGEKRSAECIAIQAKILKSIASIKISSEWQAVAETDAYKDVVAAHESLSSANCHEASEGSQTDACIALTNKLNEEGDALAQTTAWKKFMASSSHKTFFSHVAKGETMGCIKTTDMPQGKK